MTRQELPVDRGAPGRARSAVRSEFEGKFPQEAVEGAVLAASELVSAVLSSGPERLTVDIHDGDGKLHVQIEAEGVDRDLEEPDELRRRLLDGLTERWSLERDIDGLTGRLVAPPG